jgi:hypothetical protein
MHIKQAAAELHRLRKVWLVMIAATCNIIWRLACNLRIGNSQNTRKAGSEAAGEDGVAAWRQLWQLRRLARGYLATTYNMLTPPALIWQVWLAQPFLSF